MLSISPSMIARSSMEEMLESLRQNDNNEKPKDLVKPLPPRPKSKARLPPSARLGLGLKELCQFGTKKDEVVMGSKVGVFGAKRARIMHQSDCESPYDGRTNVKEFESDDNLSYFINKKLRVWCRLQNGEWVLGEIQSTSGDEASVLLLDGNVVTVSRGELLPANPDVLEGVDDLTQLSYLNEPSVLHNIQYRYSRDIIYSWAGPVLIAINPFKDVDVYGNDIITAYRQKLVDSPHVYAVADTCYNEMLSDDVNQSIILSGESGAGKTETAKHAMQYLVSLGGASGRIENEILQTSCILEAFGNAKTSRNDNSSRFGKLIEIHFSAIGKICGAKIQTFLLEKSRVVQLVPGEKSFNIFYQFCAGAPSILKDRLKLKTASEYNYLNQSGCLAIGDLDDAQKFQMLMEALNTVRICKKDQEHVFEMLAAVLWLGNISFQVNDNENHAEVVADEAATNAAMLIGCNVHDLMLALSTHRTQEVNDNVGKRLTMQQAIDTRDALATYLYSSLFTWLVQEINESLEMGKQYDGRSISILDVYGFESFQKNSFEQFCINYANERMQQHFNRHLFKLQQEDYELDGIDCTKVDFEDNQECLDLFEKKPAGLISLLDEESNFPKATDLTLTDKLKQHLSDNPCFKGGRDVFSVRHYAGEVLYDTNGFLEKNRDPLSSGIIQLISSCRGRLPQLFASNMMNLLQKTSDAIQLSAIGSHKQSVGTKFKDQLFELMKQLENSRPHFVRCIKPNSEQLPAMYKKDLVLEQLRCCGVFEVVRMSRCGYPTRMTHQEFSTRYGFLLPETCLSQNPLSTSVAVLQQYGILPEMYQVGYTKLYFRVGQISALENIRKQVLQGTFEVQKCFRRNQAHCYFHDLKGGVITLQSFIRTENARRKYDAVIKSREQVARETFDEKLKAVIHLQSVIRGWLARRQFSHLQELDTLINGNSNSGRKHGRTVSEVKVLPQEHIQILASAVEELEHQVLMAGVTIGKKEEENTALREKVQQLEAKLTVYDANMKSMEGAWQNQMPSLQDLSHEHIQILPSAVEELQQQVRMAEVTIGKKEEENTALFEKVQQLEAKWTEYDANMKSMEGAWQKQMASLQMSLAAAKKCLAADDTEGQPRGRDGTLSSQCYDSEDASSLQTPTHGRNTPTKTLSTLLSSQYGAGGEINSGANVVNHLVNEFEQRKQNLENEAKAIVEYKSGQLPSRNPGEQLRRLRLTFEVWKKEFKIRLREAKAKLHKHGHSDNEKSILKWWGKKSKR